MPIQTRVDPEHGYARHQAHGKCSVDDFVEALHAIYAHPEYEPGNGGIWDLRHADLSAIASRDAQFMAEFVRRVRGPREGRTAVVVDAPREFGLARMYQVYSEGLLELKVLYDLDAALAWLLAPACPGDDS